MRVSWRRSRDFRAGEENRAEKSIFCAPFCSPASPARKSRLRRLVNRGSAAKILAQNPQTSESAHRLIHMHAPDVGHLFRSRVDIYYTSKYQSEFENAFLETYSRPKVNLRFLNPFSSSNWILINFTQAWELFESGNRPSLVSVSCIQPLRKQRMNNLMKLVYITRAICALPLAITRAGTSFTVDLSAILALQWASCEKTVLFGEGLKMET